VTEELDPAKEAQRIVRQYLSQRGWARQWRQTLAREIYSAARREELESKQRRCDQMEEAAEQAFDREIDYWQKSASPQAEKILPLIHEMLRHKTDLGFFARKIIEHLGRKLSPP
jgi:hypothetical protein